MITNRTPESLPEDVTETIRAVRLSDSSRERMRAALSAYADMHEVPVRTPVSRVRSTMVWMRVRTAYAGALALLLIVATGAQATFASEKAVPGDVLYSVKVTVAEPVALALARSPEQRATLASDFAARRIDEAVVLHTKGKLDEKTADDLAARFEKYVDTAVVEAETLQVRGNLVASQVVHATLEEKITRHSDDFVRVMTVIPEEEEQEIQEISVEAEPAVQTLSIEKELSSVDLAPQVGDVSQDMMHMQASAPVSDVPVMSAARVSDAIATISITEKFSARIKEKARLVALVRNEVQPAIEPVPPRATDTPEHTAPATASVTATVEATVPVEEHSPATSTDMLGADGIPDVSISVDAAIHVDTKDNELSEVHEVSTTTGTTTASTTATTSTSATTPISTLRIEKASVTKEILPILRKMMPFIGH